MDSTTDDGLPMDAIIVNFKIQTDQSAAEEVIRKLTELVSEQEYDSFLRYMTSKIAYSLLSDENSPVVESMHEAFGQIIELVQAEGTELQGIIREQSEVIATQNKEIIDLKSRVATLLSRVESLSGSLSRARKLLKAEEIKEAMSFCDKLRRQRAVSEIAQVAMLLADGIKDTLVTTKGN